MTTTTIPSLVAFASCAAIALANPPVSDLGLLPGDTRIGPAFNTQTDVAAALGATSTLVVWSDYRSQLSGNGTNQSAGDIFGIRIGPDGEPLDPAPFAVFAGLGEQRSPEVAWNGQDWLVVFRSQDPTSGYFENRIRAARVSSEGQVLDETPITLAPNELPFKVAGLNGQWMVTYNLYHDDGYGTYIAGQRIDAGGAILDPTPRVAMDWSYGAMTLLSAGDEYLVAGADWNDSNVFRAQRLGSDGLPIGQEFTTPSLSVAANGQGFFVTWFADFVRLAGSRMTRQGVLLDPSGLTIAPEYSQYHSNSVSFDGRNWWVVWGAGGEARTVRIDDLGSVLDPAGGVPIPADVGPAAPKLQPRAGEGVQLFWSASTEQLGSDTNAWTIPMNGANEPGLERCVSTGTATQLLPDLCAGPNGTSAIVLTSTIAGDVRVLANRLDAGGRAIWAEPVVVAQGPNFVKASIAWNGSVFLVAYDEGDAGLSTTRVKARRMNPDGTFVDAQPFDVMPGFSPDVDAVGDDFLVACSRFVTFQVIGARAMRIDGPTGAPLDASPLTLLNGYVSAGPRVKSDGTRWIVCYHSQWSHDSSQSDIAYNLVNPDGSFTPARNPTTVAGGSATPDVAWSGEKFLFVWRGLSASQANIHGRTMNPDGSFDSGSFVIAALPGAQIVPTVAWDGSTFIAAWDDQRNQQAFFDERTDVYAARISEGGVLLDPAGVPIVTSRDGDVSAAVFSDGSGRTLIASARFSLAAPWDSYRVGISLVGDAPCAADINADGVLNIFDFLAFQTAFSNGDASADFNDDGLFNIFDFLAFQTAFGNGC